MLPITCKEWERQRSLCHAGRKKPFKHLTFCISEKKAIEHSATWLIERLYEPDGQTGYRVRASYLDDIGIDKVAQLCDEPINWGDLGVYVEQDRKRWFVTLEEASEGQCPILCKYVQSWLEKWGWTIEVRTSW